MTPLNGGILEVYHVKREYSCLAYYFQVTVEVENLWLPLTHLGLLGRSAMANREYSWIG